MIILFQKKQPKNPTSVPFNISIIFEGRQLDKTCKLVGDTKIKVVVGSLEYCLTDCFPSRHKNVQKYLCQKRTECSSINFKCNDGKLNFSIN